MSAISANDIWAVGTNDYGSSYPGGATLTLHWDGQAWTRIPSPNVGTVYDGNMFLGVDAVSPSDVWAVGYYQTSAPGSHSLIEHWNGVQWNIMPSPSVPNTDNHLEAVAAISSNDVWAVGYFIAADGNRGYPQTVALHWNGNQWTTIPTPNAPLDQDEFLSVSVITSNDVWAVGAILDTNLQVSVTLTEHWDGSQWSIVPSPSPPCTDCGTSLYGVDAISSVDIWAAGQTVYVGGGDNTVTEHWDGNQWSIVGSPNSNSTHNELDAIIAISPTDVWSVGYCGLGVLIEHWDGNQWSIVPNPAVGYLLATTSLSSTDVWAVGYYYSCQGTPCGYRTLTEHYSDPCASSTTPTPNPPPSPTVTPTTIVTATPTAQPVLVGHVDWESRPAQPNGLQQLPITLTLKSSTTEVNYPTQTTDQYGFFTITLGSLPSGTYNWRVDDTAAGQHSPNYLANAGTVSLPGVPVTNAEMGMMRAGDANNDNIVNVSDFNMLKVSFGFGCGNPAYDSRADFTGDCLVDISDFAPLKRNFGQQGAPPIGPARP